MRKTRRTLLLGLIFLSLGGVAYKVTDVVNKMKQEFKRDPIGVLNRLPESALHMKDFHRAKIEDGRKVWEIFGDEANYFKEQKEALIKKPRFYYYDKQGDVIETIGARAHVYLNEKEMEKMELQGGIKVTFQGYVLESEEASYIPAKDQIFLSSRTTVVGDGIALEGASMEVEMEGKKIRLVRNVKTKIEPDKLAEKKNQKSSNRRIGG